MIWLAYLLAGMWAVGCFVIGCSVCWAIWDDGEPGYAIMAALVLIPAVLVIGLFPIGTISENDQTTHIKLSANDWICTAQIRRQHTTQILSGKVLVPVTNYETVCTQYNLKD